jgi:hypothetical protein
MDRAGGPEVRQSDAQVIGHHAFKPLLAEQYLPGRRYAGSGAQGIHRKTMKIKAHIPAYRMVSLAIAMH